MPEMSLAERLAEVENRISTAAHAANRLRSDIELIAVTKNHPASLVIDLLSLGVTNFGENRDQDAKPKALEVAGLAGETNLPYKWHFIGQLQSNKVRSALTYASTIHSLDRQSLLDALKRASAELQEPTDVFIQLNLTQDPGRGGIEPKNLIPFAEQVLESENLNLLGVMGVASLEREPDEDFAAIRESSEKLREFSPSAKFISAGMSEDFEAAILFGATHLRIGSAITANRTI